MNRQRLLQLDERRLNRLLLRLPEIPKIVETQAEAVQVTAEAQAEAVQAIVEAQAEAVQVTAEAQVEAVQAIVETQVEAKVVVKPEVQKPQEINYCF